ncbi:thioesterase domain-containing protein [Bacillus cereus group sp. BfR-BA-01441]|uniref:thioesterase II family protein n=1 Tax=Bacillus cereus group sp. BfR-BA-01441 TaxID=2920348 RepID=UPI001F57769F
MKLICLPYAGSSARVFNTWRNTLLPEIEIKNIELSGRGKRIRETCYKNIADAVEDIYNIIDKEIDDSPYIIFGHSMGSILAFELGHKIQQENRRMPEAFFFSGKPAPDQTIKEFVHLYKDVDLIGKIFKLGGTPPELIQNKKLLDIYLPIIRADYKIVETYKFQDKKKKLNAPFYILYGNKDEFALHEILAWKNHTSKYCTFYEFDGGHFFIKEQEKSVLNLINTVFLDELKIGVYK